MANFFYVDDELPYDLLPLNTFYTSNNISDDSSTSSEFCTPEGLNLPLSLPNINALDSYAYSSFGSSCGIAPQALHEPLDKDELHPLLLAPQEEEPVREENEDEDTSSVYADSNDNEATYDDDYVEFVKPRPSKAPASVAPSSALKRRRSSAFPPLDFVEEERPAKRLARTAPSSPTQTKQQASTHAKSLSPTPHKPRNYTRRGQPSPRNIQLKERTPLSKSSIVALNFVCPQRVNGCRYHSKSKRLSDFTRHLATHQYMVLNKAKNPICIGVRLSDAHMFGLKGPRLQDVYTIEEDHGAELWVGGCRKSFSRSDALRRHFKRDCKDKDDPICVCYGASTRKA
ncbi:hypothetical protein JR316_0006924 [Psilocybe cubensis]|uniref:Uncharacterized protein n=2 Tax=Psilocybe cubensis TaxID=181762 RepID=A0ACB8GYL7_PSICU|nr:hypothetical protein JR316_0006924 [Psilocybe cubensis]KAH9480326.1 hypothetical protein JR316_0006924 [Psilocybe cubensis]